MRQFKHTAPTKSTTVHSQSFDGMSDFAEYVQSIDHKHTYSRDNDDKWAGGSFAQAQQWARQGDMSGVEKSESFLSKFEALAFNAPARQWVNDITGVLPNIPAYLAGHPQAMRRRTRIESDSAPITIYADVFVSCAFEHEQIIKRGSAVLALVRILSTRRAVTLYVGCTSHGHHAEQEYQATAIRLDTQPLDLARASFALTHPAFVRRLSFLPLAEMGAGSSIPSSDGFPLGELLSACIDPQGPILICPPMVGADSRRSEAWENPEKWIENQLRTIAPEMLPEGI